MGALRRLWEPTDIASLAMFRILFGVLMFAGSLRFVLNGWVDRFFVQPTFFFKYWGFAWVDVLPPAAMYLLFIVCAVAALFIALGWFYRYAVAVFWVVFTYVELIDVSNYLNHYYLVSLLAGILLFLPANRMWSLDVRLGRVAEQTHMPAWMLLWLRAQVGTVYVFAALAKFNTDWLVHAQPLHIWLAARSEMPVFGGLLAFWPTALVMSWAGFLFDLTIVGWLLWRRSRPWAYAALLTFHVATGFIFSIGMFPFIMGIAATLFFAADWPRRAGRPTHATRLTPTALQKGLLGFAAVWMAVQVSLPWRHLAYPGDVSWNEQGMRWSWKVMVREKNGDVTYRVKVPGRREVLVSPRKYLVNDQEREFSAQPDLILQLGKHIGRAYAAEFGQAEVRVDAWVSWNGRRAARLIDPNVDLMLVEDDLGPAVWVLDEPSDAPARRNK